MRDILIAIEQHFSKPAIADVGYNCLKENQFDYAELEGNRSYAHLVQILLQDISLNHTRICFQDGGQFKVIGRDELLQLVFVVKGKYLLSLNNRDQFSISQTSHNLLYLKKGSLQFSCEAGEEIEYLEVQLRRSFVQRFLPSTNPLHQLLLKGKAKKFSTADLPFNPQIQRLVFELISCDFNADLKHIYLQAKIMELLTQQLSQFEEQEQAAPGGLKSADIQKMNVVRAIITGFPEKEHTLSSLARAAGTNEQYLKSHFKLIYGKTVFAYLTAYRMDLAKELLIEGQKKISDIALDVGYRQATHFTQAFKRHFGYLPLKIKRSIK